MSAEQKSQAERQMPLPGSDEGFITKAEVACRLKKAVRTIEDWQRRGYIPFIKTGRSVLFDVQVAVHCSPHLLAADHCAHDASRKAAVHRTRIQASKARILESLQPPVERAIVRSGRAAARFSRDLFERGEAGPAARFGLPSRT